MMNLPFGIYGKRRIKNDCFDIKKWLYLTLYLELTVKTEEIQQLSPAGGHFIRLYKAQECLQLQTPGPGCTAAENQA